MSRIKNLSEQQLVIQESIQSQVMMPELINMIIEKPPITIAARMSIYQEAYQSRLVGSLQDDFSRVKGLVGEVEFEKLALNFIKITPSTASNLAEYSEKFPNFVKIHLREAAEFAFMDWSEILSTQAANPESQLSSQEIQSGCVFKIQRLPSTILNKIDHPQIIFYRQNDKIQTLNITSIQLELLDFLEQSKTIEELSQFAKQQNINDDLLVRTIEDWIGKSIIFCKSTQGV